MPSLKHDIINDTLDKVTVIYLDRRTARWWNERRRADDTIAFCGWFWINGTNEAGPFHTQSAAIRDAYYRFVLRRPVPQSGHQAEIGPRLNRPSRTARAPHAPQPLRLVAGG